MKDFTDFDATLQTTDGSGKEIKFDQILELDHKVGKPFRANLPTYIDEHILVIQKRYKKLFPVNPKLTKPQIIYFALMKAAKIMAEELEQLEQPVEVK